MKGAHLLLTVNTSTCWKNGAPPTKLIWSPVLSVIWSSMVSTAGIDVLGFLLTQFFTDGISPFKRLKQSSKMKQINETIG